MAEPWEDLAPLSPVRGEQVNEPWMDIQTLDRIADEGGPANPPQPPVRDLRFQDNVEGDFIDRTKRSGQQYSDTLMRMDPMMLMKGVSAMFTGEGLERLKDYYVESYGSVDAAKKTASQDPVGFLSDVSMLGTPMRAAGWASKTPKLSQAGAAIENLDPLTNVTTGAKNIAANTVGAGYPERTYEQALNSSGLGGKKYQSREAREQVIGQLLKDDVPITPRGTEKYQAKISNNLNKLDDMVEGAQRSGKMIPMRDVMRYVRALREEVTNPITNPESAIDKAAINKYLSNWFKELGPVREISPNDLRKLRQNIDGKRNWSTIDTTTPPIQQQLRRSIASGARQSLAEAVDTSPNQDTARNIGKQIEALEAVNRGANKQQQNNRIGLRAGMASAGSAPIVSALGWANDAPEAILLGAVLGGGGLMMTRPNAQRLARMVYKNQNIDEAMKRNLIRKIISQTQQNAPIAAGEYEDDYMRPPE